MKNIKKYTFISFVLFGMMFATASPAQAESNNVSSFYQRLTAITAMMEISKNFPSFAVMLEPIILEHIQSLFSDLDSFDKNDEKDEKYDDKNKYEKDKDKDKHDDDDDSDDNDDVEYKVDNITELEAEPYENIDNKWEVEITFGDHKDYTFYVYDIDGENDLIANISDKIEDEFDFEISDGEVADILEIKD